MNSKKQTFIVIFKPGSAWIEGKPLSEQRLQEHGKYMLGLYAAGIMLFAGSFSDNSGGAAVFETEGVEEANCIVSNDPAVISGIFVYELHSWQLVAWDQFLKK